MPAPRLPDDAARRGARAVPRDGAEFPAGLLELPDCPPVVCLRGGPLPLVERAVAVVGSRAASAYGTVQAGRIAGDLARLGYVVVSGLARGIDAAAHRGALAAGGRTVAVIASGLDAITPRHHEALAATIARRGALVSEREGTYPANPGLFLRRNRLIAALASATVVVEAAERSGALTTAACAVRQGRPVLAVPGDVDRDTARGCHALIRRGARICERAADVIEAIVADEAPRVRHAQERLPAAGVLATPDESEKTHAPGPATAEARLLAVLGNDPRTADRLAAAAGLPLAEALAALLALQWAGAAVSHPGQRWTRVS